MFDDNKISKNEETRVCKVCGEELPLDRFELIKPKNKNPYLLNSVELTGQLG